MEAKQKVVVILGPTSSGKTEMSLKLAKKFNGVIISADSRQIYKDMDIATAKVKKTDRQNIPHYMLDIVKPNEEFTLSLYQKTVLNLLNSIAKNNFKKTKKILPFIVGGTGLYIKSIIDGYKIPNIPPNKKLRDDLNKKSLEELIKKLTKLDPCTNVDISNKRRVIRAIEILNATGNLKLESSPPNFDFLQIGILVPRDKLNQRIIQKIEAMYKEGLVKETKILLNKDYDINLPAMSVLGYQHIYKYLKNKITLKQALELMVQSTKRFAKRQMTWFKKDKRINWITNYSKAEKLIQKFLN